MSLDHAHLPAPGPGTPSEAAAQLTAPFAAPFTAPFAAPFTAPFSELTTRRLGPVRRYFVRHVVAMDVLVVVIFTATWLLTLVVAGPSEPEATGVAWTATTVSVAVAASIAGSAALFWRRRFPLAVTCTVVALLVVTLVVTRSAGAFELAIAFAVYAVASSRPPWVAWTVLVGALAVTSGAIAGFGAEAVPSVDESGVSIEMDPRPIGIAGYAVESLIALAIGTSVRNRRLHIADLVERGNALARDREQQAELARAAERSLIAREMHDVVAHSLSVMIALADGAGVALDRSPDKARVALDELSATGRTALTDMRRVLGVLNRDGAPLEPQPGHTDLGALVERFRTAGLTVRTRGLDADLPGDATVQLAVYRIVQESLTNALRHAPGCIVDLAVTAADDVVTVEVASQGGRPTADSPGTGRGLIGMRERAAVYGGTVVAGPWRDGWQVLATLPWRKDTP